MLGMAAPCLSQAAALKPLRIVSSHLPPLVLESGEMPGALMELVQELCRRLQLAPAVEFVPWQRAMFIATGSAATAIFPLTRTPAREQQFRWLAPLYEERFIFLAPRASGFDVRHPLRMHARRITIMRGAAQQQILAELGYHNLVEANSIDEVHRFLVGGMADAAFGERNIIETSLRVREERTDFILSEPIRRATAWLAGSLDFSAADAARYQRTMAAMVADGFCQRIFKKYGMLM